MPRTRRKKLRDDAKASGIDAFCPVMSASQTVWGCRRYVAVEAARGALNRISVATKKARLNQPGFSIPGVPEEVSWQPG